MAKGTTIQASSPKNNQLSESSARISLGYFQ